jgi:protein-disulfide isomerase
VKISFKHFPLSFHRNAPLAHQAALAAAQQGKFWEMHDWIFAHQSTMERQDLIKGAGEIGLDVPKFTADIDSGAYKAIIDSDREEGLGLGVDGTPTFFINGHKVQNAGSVAEFRNWIEDALVLAPPSDTETGRATDAALTRGPAGAPVQIVWYSDLASPLTTRASELIHQILAAYPGQVQVVFRNFPQPVAHPAAKLAHEAAMAAAEHGKFWEMAACVAGRQELSVADVDACAGQTGIDLKRFASSLSAGAYRPAIERDLAEAERLRVKGSPVFFVNGKRIDGLQQLPIFKVFIDADLKQPGVGGQ